jgi:ABC-type dipeptide/oligopeptide/nickel transport system permease component
MNSHKSFFVFLLVLFLMCSGVGLYVFHLDSCAKQADAFPIMECYKLYMAFGVLFAVAIMLSLGAGFYALIPPPAAGDHPGKLIFDTLSKTLLPVITLVLGYYFGSAQVTNNAAAEKSAKAQAQQPEQGASKPSSGVTLPQKGGAAETPERALQPGP